MPLQTRLRSSGCTRGGARTLFRWFQKGQESGSEPNVSESLRECSQDPGRVLDLAGGEQGERCLEDETAEARKLGIFGSPTFVVAGELFWGDDRLEDAISWRKCGRVQSVSIS